MAYNTKSQKIGLAYKKQSAVQTGNVAADFWLLTKTNSGFGTFSLNTENDATDIGTGSEWGTTTFASSKDVSASIEKRMSSEFAAWLAVFGIGGVVTTVAQGTTGKKYTVKTPAYGSTLDLPTFSYIEQLGTVDRMAVGCAVNSFSIRFQTGPGRNTTTASAEIVGCGSIVEPSAITLPSTLLAENLLSKSSATVTINGIDYVANKSLMDLTFNYSNNVRLDTGYYIGSGTENGFDIRGRMERGVPTASLSYTARMESGGTEFTKLKNLTSGTAVITLTGGAFESTYNHKLTITMNKCQFSTVTVSDSNGLATVNVAVNILDDLVNGPLSMEVINQTANIG